MSPDIATRLLALDTRDDTAADWEKLVQATPASGFMQSLHWAAFKKALGYEVVHVGLFQGEALIGGAIAYGPPRPQTGGLWVVPEGPVLPWGRSDLAATGLRLIVTAVERETAGRGALGLRIEPRLEPPLPRLMRNFTRAPVDLVPPSTLYLDIAPDEAALLADMHPKGRYNIRLAGRRGVTVSADRTPQAAQRFLAVVSEAAERDDFFLEPGPFFAGLADCLGGPAGMAQFLFAEHQGDTVGALLLLTYGKRATYLYGGVSNFKRNHMAGYSLQWEAIRMARATGCTVYDFYGFDPTGDPAHMYSRFSRFKRLFGGRAVRFIGSHQTYFLDRVADAVVSAARAWA